MKVEISKLSNGLILVTDPMPQLESAALGVWVNAGGRNETPANMGISHMLEHMAFKGTARRSARDIAEEIEAVGGFLNAYTSREQTAFHARVLKADIPLALDLLSDILIAPTFDPSELEREQQVVLQEIGQAQDTPDDIVFDNLQGVIYPDQPLGWPILGNTESVSRFTPDELRSYMRSHYRAAGMTVVVSGAVSHDAVLHLVAEKFAAMNAGEAPEAALAKYVGGERRDAQDLEQVHFTCAFRGIAHDDPDYYAAQVYVTALGGGMSSRLFQEAREKRGLCYSIYSFANSFRDGGIIGIYAGTGESEAADLAPVIAGEMTSLAESATDAEIARARAQLKSSMLMGLERPSNRAEQIAGSLFAYGRFVTPEEIVARLDAVDSSAVRRFGARIVSSGPPSVAVIGPSGKLEDYDTFARRFHGAGTRHAAE